MTLGQLADLLDNLQALVIQHNDLEQQLLRPMPPEKRTQLQADLEDTQQKIADARASTLPPTAVV
jgi:hypothetical protein